MNPTKQGSLAPTIDALSAPFFSGSRWNIAASGGAGISSFQQTFTLPRPLRWTNRETLRTLARTADLSITWDARGYGPADIATVQLLTFPPSNTPLPEGLSAGFTCRTAARAGRLVVPSSLLRQIVSTLPGFSSSLSLDLSSTSAHATPFEVHLPQQGPGPMIVNYFSSQSIPVTVE